MNYYSFIYKLEEISIRAGKIIMEHYNGDLGIEIKADSSPVTVADIAANNYIVAELKKLALEIPIVSEESANDMASSKAPLFWMVDPLDGTKSYIKHTGEFTVNIALIENRDDGAIPVLGVVYLPVKEVLYYTGEDSKAYKKSDGGEAELISVRTPPAEGLVVVASKSHRTPETDEYIEKLPELFGFPVKEFLSASSSLKFCLLAEGQADIYPRFGPTMEWDTAAAHAVLIAAGGKITDTDGAPFLYGKDDYRNGFFIAFGFPRA